jgi:hypothetical protein
MPQIYVMKVLIQHLTIANLELRQTMSATRRTRPTSVQPDKNRWITVRQTERFNKAMNVSGAVTPPLARNKTNVTPEG